MKAAKPISEAKIQQACDDFLALDGWRKIVTDPPQLRGLGVSEKGIPDRLYLRYHCGLEWSEWMSSVAGKPKNWFRLDPSDKLRISAQVLWVEHKKKGGKAALHQKAWHAHERALGALVWVAGEDFPASIEGFQAHYVASGLNRRMTQPLLKVQLGEKLNAE